MTTTVCAPMSVKEFLTLLDERKLEEQNVRRNPVLAVTVIHTLQAERDEAVALLRELEPHYDYVLGVADHESQATEEQKEYLTHLRAFLTKVSNG